MPGPIEDYKSPIWADEDEDEDNVDPFANLAPDLALSDWDYDTDQNENTEAWIVPDDLAYIEYQETVAALSNPIIEDGVAHDSETSQPLGGKEPLGGNEEQPQTGFLPPGCISKTNIAVVLPNSTLIAPRYMYQGEELPAEPVREWTAVQRLLDKHRHLSSGDDDFIDFDLDQFSIYTDPYTPGAGDYDAMKYAAELRPLQHLSLKRGSSQMYVDGVLSIGDSRCFVRKIPFEELPIGNYGISEDTVGSNIWIRSTMNARRNKDRRHLDVYYRLKSPAPEYKRFHLGFLWVADLAKHVIDYISTALEEHRLVTLKEFSSDFNQWLNRMHGSSGSFNRWRTQYPRSDFRTAVAANVEFIHKEACGVLGPEKVQSVRLWAEIYDFTAYGDPTPHTTTAASSPSTNHPDATQIPKTIVTPYIQQLFSHLPFGPMMQPLSPSSQTEALRQHIIANFNMESSSRIHSSVKQMADHELPIREISVGDVISTERDEVDTHWAKDDTAGFGDVNRWFGLVQKVHKLRDGLSCFDVLWFYRPSETTCGVMRYPWNNELFLSDHCSCDDKEAKIKSDEVVAVHCIEWGGSSTSTADFFCRQTYMHTERQWITFQSSHMRCKHHQEMETQAFPYKVGDTLLVASGREDDTVEPAELVTLPDEADKVVVRILHRRHRLEPNVKSPPNELLYGNDLKSMKKSSIHGRCLVRCFQPDEPLPPPYDRNGVGNAFFVTHRLQSSGGIVPIDGSESLRQGFDPSKPFTKLRGVDLFCGGGNFGRGLEEGGAVEMNWANDINIKAIHTYMANAPSHVHPFAGSIDDLQRLALEANFRDNVPEVGSVDFVAAGSPCQGFSSLTQDKTDPRQRKNQSLVAAFASFIDTYRPKYGLLENVMAIVQSRGKRAEDVFCQLICAIVGMGYQTQFWVLDAWTHGSPQSRSRVFLSFAAPGLSLPKMPLHSHSHYQENIRTNTLGWLPNRQPMVERLVMPTPFKFVTTQQATADLPDIQDGKPDICVGFPDHRVAYSITKRVRNQFSVIPTHPHGMSLATSWQGGHGVMTKADRDFFPFKGKKANGAKSRAWSRVPPNKIMATITASGATPADAFTGGVLHWNQDRVITVMESRRAQGFLDHEVILGRPREQWRVVGNSVAREVSLALGLSFREAWLGSLIDGDETQPDEKVPVRLPTTNYVVADSADSTTANTRDNSRTSTPSSMTSRSTCRTVPAKRPLSSTISVEEFVAEASRATRPRAASDGLRGSTALSAGKKPLTPSERESTMDERPPASPELVRIVSDVV